MSEPLFHGRKHPDADCEGCAFYAKNHIVNDLPIDTTVAVVAEVPGNYELRSKTPISGPAGNVLDGALEDVGITKIARLNMVQCAGKTPSANVFHRCLPALHADLDRLPNLQQVLLLGGPPAKEFLNEPITSARVGAPRHNEQHNVEVVATWHPAYFMHNADRYPSFVHDIGKLSHPMPTWEEPIFFVWNDIPQAVSLLERLLDANDKFVVDIEVGVDKDLMGHPERYAWLCIGVCVEKGVVHIFGEEALKSRRVLDLFDRMMQTKEITCHNGKFDLAAFKDGRLHFDTMIASYILDERQGVHSLDFLSQELLGSPDWKHIVKPYLSGPSKTYADIPRPILYKYCAFDVHNTWLLEDYFRERHYAKYLTCLCMRSK
jgi:uracil-DNA glycosylase family 4